MISPGELVARPERRWRFSQAAAVALLLALALCVTLVITLPPLAVVVFKGPGV